MGDRASLETLKRHHAGLGATDFGPTLKVRRELLEALAFAIQSIEERDELGKALADLQLRPDCWCVDVDPDGEVYESHSVACRRALEAHRKWMKE